MKKYNFIGREHILLEKEDIRRLKFIQGYYHSLPLNSGLRRIKCRLSAFLLRMRFAWYRLIGKQVIPMFEIASNPSIKLSEIKERRFKIKEDVNFLKKEATTIIGV